MRRLGLAIVLLAAFPGAGCEPASAATCSGACSEGLSCCGPAGCVDLASDARHCGGCTIACRADQSCSAGQCRRADGGTPDAGDAALGPGDASSECRPSCSPGFVCQCGRCMREHGVASGDGRTDPTFGACGGCDLACDPERASRCGTGATAPDLLACYCGDAFQCVPGERCTWDGTAWSCTPAAASCGTGPACAPGETCFAGVCGCDVAGHSCAFASQCVSGQCVCGTAMAVCATGTECDGTSCIDVTSDPMHCGHTWRACAPGEGCVAGECHCGSGPPCARAPGSCGQICCGDACVDPTVDRCGGCAVRCADDQVCALDFATVLCADPSTLAPPGRVQCEHGEVRADPACSGVDCSAMDGPCVRGVCAHGVCSGAPLADGTTCGTADAGCTRPRCTAGTCAPGPAQDCSACGAGMACVQGSCGAAPTSLDDGFEDGLFPTGWISGAAGTAPWIVDTGTAHGGTRALRAGTIADGQTSRLTMPIELDRAATLSFWARVGAEVSYDNLELRVDGVLRQRLMSSPVPSWVEVREPLAAGAHTIEWRYAKDRSLSIPPDTAWIDDVHVAVEPVPAPLCGG